MKRFIRENSRQSRKRLPPLKTSFLNVNLLKNRNLADLRKEIRTNNNVAIANAGLRKHKEIPSTVPDLRSKSSLDVHLKQDRVLMFAGQHGICSIVEAKATLIATNKNLPMFSHKAKSNSLSNQKPLVLCEISREDFLPKMCTNIQSMPPGDYMSVVKALLKKHN